MRIKVCCIESSAEASLAVALGANALGLVSEMPSGPGVLEESQIAAIVATVPPSVETWLLTSKVEVSVIVEQQHRCRVAALQLCRDVGKKARGELKSRLPGVRLIQVVHVEEGDALARVVEAATNSDALLLDSGSKSSGQLGGTGRVHDWAESRKIVLESSLPVFLAGGLQAANVAEAIDRVRPFAVDVCSGVRTRGQLDRTKLSAFVDATSRRSY